jgi:uroporphyrinogen decarboxylase
MSATPSRSDLLLRAARGQRVERPPVWLMRQAGRILPEYRAVRASVSGFIELVQTPELVREVTLQPVDLLGVDAAIIFSDILVVPEAMGAPYTMVEKVGPRFPEPIRGEAAAAALRVADPADLHYTIEGIRLTRAALDARAEPVPLIGFAGAPWTIFCYLVEGGGSKTFSWPRRWLHARPAAAEALLDRITESTLRYLEAQIDAGAQIVQLFDSWAGVLSPALYRRFALPGIRRIAEALAARPDAVPLTVFAKDAWFALEDFAKIPGVSVIGLDWQQDAARAARLAPGKVYQGNLDPTLLYADPETVAAGTRAMLEGFANPHIANLGHGVYPDTPLEGVRAFIETVQGWRYAGADQ